MNEAMLDGLRNAVRSHMDEKRYRHTLGVEKEMRYLAEALLPDKLLEASAAALLHDITKCMSWDAQREYALAHDLGIDADECLAPALLHAKTGAHFTKENFADFATDGVTDAIMRHTTAHPPLTLLSAMLFVADFTEEGRTYPDCVSLRTYLHAEPLSLEHFKKVLLRALDLSLEELLREGRPIAFKTVEARNALLTGKSLF